MGKINEELLKEELKCNIIAEEDTKLIISKVMEVLSSAISNSLGPYGSTTVIQDPYNIEHSITKDGYSILNKISFRGGLENAILTMVKKISKSLVQEVGDGSTSSIVVAKAMYDLLDEFFRKNNIPRKDVLDFLDALEKEVERLIKLTSKPLNSKEELMKVASISNNNDNSLGELVADIYDELDYQGFINLELSPTSETYHKITNGVEILRGYINFIYVNQNDKITCTFEEPRVLMVNDELGEEDMFFLAELLTLSMASEFPLVIIAKGYSSDITNFLNNNKAKHKKLLNIVPIEYDLSSMIKMEEFQDLAVYLNGTIYDKYNGERLDKSDAGKFFLEKMGRCAKVVVNEKRTLLIEGEFNEEAVNYRMNQINELEEAVREKGNVADISDELYILEKRRNQLKGKIASLYIGGASDIEKKTRKDLVEDSIYACKSAIEHGYVIGGNLIIPSILMNSREEITDKLVVDKSLFKGITNTEKHLIIRTLIDLIILSFKKSFHQVLFNKYKDDETCTEILNKCLDVDKELQIFNLKTSEYETIENTEVVNSAKTDIEIMKSVFSIIGLLASSNQMLAIDNLYEY